MPKFITTELGKEKQCTCCGDYYPIHKDFFYKDGLSKQGRQLYTSQCKACYKFNYQQKGK